ncbi:uncharacterized protein RAG0_17541 [Rhynchosporium agropyri]|uniref:Secreted protein n=1 Tax=Rhynchosporium agropyri TaxID=914238 RepID=A0A1E1LTW2_9HELO|nr:uncharacterized protein RAG0_17541 [Rhynchosporium agropyri]
MKFHFALLPLLGLCITSLSVPAETPPTSKAQGIDAKSDTWTSSVSTPFVSSPEDGSVSTNLATRDDKTDAAIYEHGLDKRTIHYFRRVVHLSLKHAVRGITGSWKFVLLVGYKDENTLSWSVDNAGSSAGTSVTKEVFHIDHRFANGWDGTFQFAFKAVTNAGDYFRLRLRWDDFIGPAKQGIDEITNAWCALVLPTTEEGLDQTQFSFTMTDDQSAH